MATRLFDDECTRGYLPAELDALNDEWDALIDADGLEPGTDEYYDAKQAFMDAVARGPVPARYAIGDRVGGGEPGTDDHDTGTVEAVDGDVITVSWDSQRTTTHHAEDPPVLRSI